MTVINEFDFLEKLKDFQRNLEVENINRKLIEFEQDFNVLRTKNKILEELLGKLTQDFGVENSNYLTDLNTIKTSCTTISQSNENLENNIKNLETTISTALTNVNSNITIILTKIETWISTQEIILQRMNKSFESCNSYSENVKEFKEKFKTLIDATIAEIELSTFEQFIQKFSENEISISNDISTVLSEFGETTKEKIRKLVTTGSISMTELEKEDLCKLKESKNLGDLISLVLESK